MKKRILALSVFIVAGTVNSSNADRAASLRTLYGTWVFDETVCFANCGARTTLPYGEFKGRFLILQSHRYENPLDGAGDSLCKTGVDLSAVRLQDGAFFVRHLPVDGDLAARRDPEELGITHKAVPAGMLICKGDGNLGSVLLPDADHLLLAEEGNVFASFHRSSDARRLNDSQALSKLAARVYGDKVYKPHCVTFESETSGEDAFSYAVREVHGNGCPGDPNTSPVVARFRVLRTDGRIEWDDIVQNQWRPYEMFLKTRVQR